MGIIIFFGHLVQLALTCVPYGDIIYSARTHQHGKGVVIMFKKSFEAIRAEFSGQAAKGYVRDITRYHRIQASPGFREAAHYCLQRLREAGIQA